MANLKSYSCPKCGGVLSVDIDKYMIDCPFCGNRFSYVEFHKKDILELAENWCSAIPFPLSGGFGTFTR